jgi:hypothetical protein
MTATIGEAIGGTNEYECLGLELLQAIINHFIPSEAVNLLTIFTEWNDLHKKSYKQLVESTYIYISRTNIIKIRCALLLNGIAAKKTRKKVIFGT